MTLWDKFRPAQPGQSGRSSASNTRGGVRDLTDQRTSGMPKGSGGVSGGGNGQPYSLAAIPDGDVLANISGGSAAPIGNTASAILDHVFSNARGAILYRGASLWAALAPGTSGFFLETQGAGADPQWAAAGGGIAVDWLGAAIDSGAVSIDFEGVGFKTVATDGSHHATVTVIGTLPLVNGDINTNSGQDNYPGLVTTPDGQCIAVPL